MCNRVKKVLNEIVNELAKGNRFRRRCQWYQKGEKSNKSYKSYKIK